MQDVYTWKKEYQSNLEFGKRSGHRSWYSTGEVMRLEFNLWFWALSNVWQNVWVDDKIIDCNWNDKTSFDDL